MSETLINSNQIRDGIGGKIKILNVIQEGTLNRDGAVFSGFSTSNYLQIGARVDKGILSLDSATYTKDFGSIVSIADSWEMVIKFKFVSQTVSSYDKFICLYCNCTVYGTSFGFDSNLKPYAVFSNSGGSYDMGAIIGTTTLVDGTTYWLKIKFTGTEYMLLLSTDGVNYNQEGDSINSATKLTKRDYWRFGSYYGEPRVFNGEIDFSETYIKANDEFVWKGVEQI